MDAAAVIGAVASALAVIASAYGGIKWLGRQLRGSQMVVEYVTYGTFEEPFDFILAKDPDDGLRQALSRSAVDPVELRARVAALGGREVAFIGNGPCSPSGLATITRLRFTLRGTTTGEVLITAIRARIIHTSPAWAGAIIHSAPQAANMAEALAFDLSGTNLEARAMTLNDHVEAVSSAPVYLQTRQVTLHFDELLSFDVLAVMQHSSARWVIDVTSSGSIVTVDNHGLPFSTTARATSYNEAWARNFSSRLVYSPCTWPDCQPQVVP